MRRALGTGHPKGRSAGWALGLALLLSGCAARKEAAEPPRPLEQTSETAQLEAMSGRQRELESELADALAEPAPRCEPRCRLQADICELAERICAVAQRHADDPAADYAATCRDSRARCERARARVAASCTCGPAAP